MPPNIESFARRLLVASKNGEIVWERSERDPDTFMAGAGSGSVRLSTHEIGEDVGVFANRLELLDADGKVVDTMETDPTRAGPWRDWEVTLNSLYDAARLIGSGTSKVIKGLADEWGLPPDPEDSIPF
jgi:hypothetical protein